MGNLIVGAILIAAVAFVIRGMVRDKKNGKSLQCGCSCSHCSGQCTKSKK
ncbi:MAG: FeoB-associated Cys-rich membrane protein [Lachnospiraceae bacterium]|nr:FeoB-associated Cys-rich membrane protein [Lachnospiraceae bacterium]